MPQPIRIYAKAHSDDEEAGEALVEALPQAEKLQMLVLRSGLFLFLAIAAIFIPVLHFILVPAFLIGSVFAGLSAFKYSQKLVSGHVRCPHCGADVTLKPAPLRWPFTAVCQSCASTLRLLDRSHREGAV